MSKSIQTIRLPFLVSFLGFVVSSVSLGIIPVIQLLPDKTESILNYIVAALFYLGLIVGGLAIKFAKEQMHRIRRRLLAEKQFEKQRFPGIITFSADRNHIILYAVCGAGILVAISDLVFHYISEFIMFPILSVILFAFTMHCIVDGENYKLFKKVKEGLKKDEEF
ncbi:MAG: hypothetical protein IJP27_08360 [Clostridia bacterium]|nr:hypothetical protein [Clostridia bacterium]